MKNEQKRDSVNIGQVDCCGAEGTTSVSVDVVSKHEALGQFFTIKIKAGSRDVGVEGVGLCAPVFSLLSTDAPVTKFLRVVLVDTVSCPDLRQQTITTRQHE